MQQKWTYIRLGGTQLELDETNSSLLHSGRTTSVLEHRLGKDETINKFAIFNCSTNSLDDSNVLKIDVIGGLQVDGLSH